MRGSELALRSNRVGTNLVIIEHENTSSAKDKFTLAFTGQIYLISCLYNFKFNKRSRTIMSR